MKLKRKSKSKLPFGLVAFLCMGAFSVLLALVLIIIIVTGERVDTLPMIAVVVMLLSAGCGVYSYSYEPPPKPDDTEARDEAAFAEAVQAFERAVPLHPREGMFSVPVIEMIDTPRVVVEVMKPILKGPLSNLRRQLNLNRAEVSGVSYRQDLGDLVPEKMRGTPREIVDGYLKGTPLKGLFDRQIPIALDDTTRFEHTFIVGPSGTGKTNLLSLMLDEDLKKVDRGEASVIVMDCTGDLLPQLTRLKRFAVTGNDSKLVLADVNDVMFPLSISLFDIGLDLVSEENRAAFRNSAVSLLTYVCRALLDMELTSHQLPPLTFALEILVEVPTANISDLIDFLRPGGKAKYQHVIAKARPLVQAYFAERFDNSKTQDRKNEVIVRLDALTAKAELSNILSSRKTRLNFYEEMNKGKVIFINIPQFLLQDEGVEMFGRFFTAIIMIAIRRRADIPEGKRKPCYFYIDECQEVVYRDTKIAGLFDGARKFKLGATLLTQRIEKFHEPVLHAIMGNAATRFATNIDDPDASRFARFMNTTASFIMHQPQYHWAYYTRGKKQKALSVPVPKSALLDEPRMSTQQYDELRALMRQRYATSVEELYRQDGPPTQDNELPSSQRPTKW